MRALNNTFKRLLELTPSTRCWAVQARWMQSARCQLCYFRSTSTGWGSSNRKYWSRKEKSLFQISIGTCALLLQICCHQTVQVEKSVVTIIVQNPMLPLRTQDFMTGVPAIPGKHLSIELVSKMVCWLTAISYLKATFAKREYMVSSGERDWNCTRHLEGALRSD